MGRLLAVVLICAGLMLPSPVEAGAWTQSTGEHYLKVWSRALLGDRAFLASAETAPLGASFQDVALDAYFEYGIDDDWTVLVHGRPIGFAAVDEESTLYVGAVDFGVRRALVRSDLRVAVQATYGYAPPIGDETLFSGTVTDENGASEPVFYAPTVETHRVEGELAVGHGFGWGWLSASVGARWFSHEAIDPALLGSVQGGLQTDFGLVASLYVSTAMPLGEVETTNVSGAGQTRYVGLGLDLSFWFDYHWSVYAGVASAFYAEANAAAAPIMLGFEHR